jgi:hypothetical protein
LCPSRGRPEKAQEAWDSFEKTKSRDSSSMWFIVDEDDESFEEYGKRVPTTSVEPSGRRGMVDPLNTVVRQTWSRCDVIGFVGDDHRFRTVGWDEIFETQLASVGGGLAYGFDGNWRDGEIPTQIFISTNILKALGWMALPAARHLYVDNAWRVIGEKLNRLYYFPDILIEHMHPAYSKADWDEGYTLVNSSEMYDHDRTAFELWLQTSAEEDVDRVRQSLARA